MKEILKRLFEHKTLSQQESKELLLQLASGAFNPLQVASFLTVYRMRSLTVSELSGFRQAMLELSLQLNIPGDDLVDLCGTGGDHKNTFNISTLAAFVVAGAGFKVAKHGNYGVSSHCGSSNVLEALGLRFTNNQELLKRDLETANICILHAPLFHPAMKTVAPIRKELAVPTFFNFLGPLVNPLRPKSQLIGVSTLEVARLYSYLYQQTDCSFVIVSSLDGYDEISMTAPFKIIRPSGEEIISPETLGFKRIAPHSLAGGSDVAEALGIFRRILDGKGSTAQRQVLLANASFAILACRPKLSFAEAYELSSQSLDSGRAGQCLQTLLKNAEGR